MVDFPKAQVRIKPKKGLAIVWNNLDKKGSVNPYAESILH